MPNNESNNKKGHLNNHQKHQFLKNKHTSSTNDLFMKQLKDKEMHARVENSLQQTLELAFNNKRITELLRNYERSMAKHKESLPLAPREKQDPHKLLEELLASNSYFLSYDIDGTLVEDEEGSTSNLLDPLLINSLRQSLLIAARYGMYDDTSSSNLFKSMPNTRQLRKNLPHPQLTIGTSFHSLPDEMEGEELPQEEIVDNDAISQLLNTPILHTKLLKHSSSAKSILSVATPKGYRNLRSPIHGGFSSGPLSPLTPPPGNEKMHRNTLVELPDMFQEKIQFSTNEIEQKSGGSTFKSLYQAHKTNEHASSVLYGEHEPLHGDNGHFNKSMEHHVEQGRNVIIKENSKKLLEKEGKEEKGHRRIISSREVAASKDIESQSINVLKRALLKKTDSHRDVLMKFNHALLEIVSGTPKNSNNKDEESAFSPKQVTNRNAVSSEEAKKQLMESRARETLNHIKELIKENDHAGSEYISHLWALSMVKEMSKEMDITSSTIRANAENSESLSGSKERHKLSHEELAEMWRIAALNKRKKDADEESRIKKKPRKIPRWEHLWLDAKRRQEDEFQRQKQAEQNASDLGMLERTKVKWL